MLKIPSLKYSLQPEHGDFSSALGNLLSARLLLLGGLATISFVLAPLLNIGLASNSLILLFGLIGITTGLQHYLRKTSSAPGPGDVFRALLLDLSFLAAFLFLTGGVTNPLVSLLLPPVAIAALLLCGAKVVWMTLYACGLYAVLLRYFIPLQLEDPQQATRLHLMGMWFSFAISAGMIAWFLLHLSNQIRTRDREIAQNREQAIRDERILAMGTLAAGAAHELGTPLASIHLLAEELLNSPGLPPDFSEDVTLILAQIHQCKKILSQLSRQAHVETEAVPAEPAARWLDAIRGRWHALRPDSSSQLTVAAHSRTALLQPDPRLEQAILNLLSNAARAAPTGTIHIHLESQAGSLWIDIQDEGGGFPEEVLSQGGQRALAEHASGQGIGLLLTQAALTQIGGELSLHNLASGGLARITLPAIKSIGERNGPDH